MICPACGETNVDEAVFCRKCRGGLSGVGEVRETPVARRRPGLITLVVYDFLSGALWLLLAGLFLVLDHLIGGSGRVFPLTGVVVVLAGVSILTGDGLRRQKSRARIPQIVLSIPILVAFPFGTAFGVLPILFLTRRSVKQWFDKSDPHAWTKDSGAQELGKGLSMAALVGIFLMPFLSSCLSPWVRLDRWLHSRKHHESRVVTPDRTDFGIG